MGTKKYHQGNYIIHDNKEIFDPQEQVNVFVKTYEDIESANEPKNDPNIQEHITFINCWFI